MVGAFTSIYCNAIIAKTTEVFIKWELRING